MHTLEDPTPEELYKKLHSLTGWPGDSFPDISSFQEKYKQNKDSKQSHDAREAFERARQVWQDDSVKEFLCTWIFVPPAKSEIEQSSPETRRELFEKIYRHIFEE